MAINAATLGRFWARLGNLKGMTQQEIAGRAGRRPEAFSHWKRGRGIELESFEAVNAALGVPPDIAMLIGQYADLPDDLILELSLLVRQGRVHEVRQALRAAGYE